jgi:WD40 repeat protein
MTAALGIILDVNSNTQKFFGGGQVANTAKNVANDEQAHTDDITAITISSDRNVAASGQVGSAPAAFVWDAKTGQKIQRFKLAKGARGVNAIAISNDGSLVALVDDSDDHNVYVYEISSGALKYKEKGDAGKIFDVAFSTKPGENTFGTAGSKHIKFWYPDQMKGEKGLFQNKGELTSFACIAYDDNGVAYTGGCNSQVYVWGNRELQLTIKAHNGGFICALKAVGQKLYSGGKDGNVAIINTTTSTVERTLSFNGVLIRAIDVVDNKALVGLRDGTIFQVDINSGAKQVIMESHSDGEVWGLGLATADTIATTGDDNKIKTWNINTRKPISTGVISNESRKAPKGGASSLTTLPDSQCARAVAVNT